VSILYDAGVLVAAERNDRQVWADHRARLDPHPHPFPNRGREANPEVGFQRQKDVLQLPLKRLLVEHFQQIGDMIVLTHRFLPARLEFEKDVAGEKGKFNFSHGVCPAMQPPIEW